MARNIGFFDAAVKSSPSTQIIDDDQEHQDSLLTLLFRSFLVAVFFSCPGVYNCSDS